MKTTRASLLAQDLKKEGWINTGHFHTVHARIAGYIFECPVITDEEIGERLAHDSMFDLMLS